MAPNVDEYNGYTGFYVEIISKGRKNITNHLLRLIIKLVGKDGQ